MPILNTLVELQSMLQKFVPAILTMTEIIEIYHAVNGKDAILAEYYYALSSLNGKVGNSRAIVDHFDTAKLIISGLPESENNERVRKMIAEVEPRIEQLRAKLPKPVAPVVATPRA